jgi:hypothetical protein
LKKQIEAVFCPGSYTWLDRRKVIPVARLQNVEPLGGKWNGQVSLGIGAVEV